MISQQRAQAILDRLAQQLDASPQELADLFARQVDNRHDVNGRRKTGFTLRRSPHGGAMLVRDPDGTDEVPPGWQIPA